MAEKITKLYCYVDESGQHTATRLDKAHIFVVAVVIVEAEQRDELETTCLGYERTSGKKKRKWSACERESKMAFVNMIIEDDRFKRSLCYSVTRFVSEVDYDLRTMVSIAKSIQTHHPGDDYKADIYIDGISKTKQVEFAIELRKLGVHVRRVHLARDESYSLIRLADAFAGLVRGAEEKDEQYALLRKHAQRKGTVIVV